MRIAYIHQYFNTPVMTGGTRSYEMARRWVDAGHEVHMVTTRRDGMNGDAGWTETEESGIRVHWLPVRYSNRMAYRERIRAFVRFARSAASKAVAVEPDIVFATSTPLTVALPAAYAKWRRRIPMVFEVRDLWPELPIAVGALTNPIAIGLARLLERFAYENADHVVALSPGMKEGVVSMGYPAERVTVIPNSSDVDYFEVPDEEQIALRARHPWLAERPLVLYAGTIGRINGVGYLADLAAETWNIDPEIRFVVIGRGAEKDMLVDRARVLGVLDRNFFVLNPVPKNEIRAWFAAADMAASLFVDLKEMWANSANKFFDALAAGTPVLINYGGWQRDLIREHGIGLALEPKVEREGAQGLASLLRDPSRLRESGRQAKRLALARFDRDRLAKELLTVLTSAAG